MFKKLFFILIFLSLSGLSFSQAYDRGIFGTSSSFVEEDTLGASDDSLTSREVFWPGYRSMRGSFTIYGKAWLLSGSSVNIAPKIKLMTDNYSSPKTYSAQQSLGDSITVADSTEINFNVSGETWWQYCKGFEVSLVPAATGSQVRFKLKEMVK